MKIWMISREYAGIAEAGGVKNVVCSLSEELAESGNDVTLFIPQYGCTDLSCLDDYADVPDVSSLITINGRELKVFFARAVFKGVKIVFVKSRSYEEKNNVYTYNAKDILINPDCIVGTGYRDSLYLDVLFQKAICEYALLTGESADVVNCHDACTASLPAIAKVLYKDCFDKTRFFVTIHNAGPAYHHEFSDINQAHAFTGLSTDVLASSLNGSRVEPYVLASYYGRLLTVSFDYASELKDFNNPNTDGLAQIFASRNIPITGITNGIDIKRYLPEDKNVSLLPYEFSPANKKLEGKYRCRNYFINNFALESMTEKTKKFYEKNLITQYGYLEPDSGNDIYISFHGRLVRQKGILVIFDLMDDILNKYSNVKFIINGQGEKLLEERSAQKAGAYPGKIVYLRGYERGLARLCTASGDFALFPSEFEPCGLEDFIAQIYGTIPVAHATGGLKKIVDKETGFTYSPNTHEMLFKILSELIEKKKNDSHCFDDMISHAAEYVSKNYSWETVAKEKYMKVFKEDSAGN
ncbi:glycogen/starch synthase [Treponema sp.]|uniref:glycogen/starch synthase n=1 Tax=Treponema sp. TaxID=166 RepID=UPI00388F91AB